MSSKSSMMKRDQRTQRMPVYMLICFIVMQVGVIFLLVAQSFSDGYKLLILATGIVLLVVGGFFLLGYLVWKIYTHPQP